jgi:hypothetical protein
VGKRWVSSVDTTDVLSPKKEGRTKARPTTNELQEKTKGMAAWELVGGPVAARIAALLEAADLPVQRRA